ncbi:unnamed protein product [Chironomus riparius]|uniref:SMB domain-containing protein n=1 Tax=Chironomus riparius TaxID=315576 RepID=A0A9N9WXJ9_9DIPT|nr:unnamed protein product [Chironomus riparius]
MSTIIDSIKVKSYAQCIIWCLIFVSILSYTEAGSCREAALCCTGRDSSCVVQKTPINAIVEDVNEKPCYCDHACLKLGDCCDDFKSHCGVIDCVLSEWGPWSECDAKCGTGMMSRTRSILRAPENGGKHCASLTQKRGCQGYKCNSVHEKKYLKESAMLLPSEFSKTRRENDTIDIRRNLKVRYSDKYKHNRDHEYCVEFEVIKATKACHKDPMYKQLIEGERVIIKCDLEAFLLHEEKEDLSDNETYSHHTKERKHLENETVEDLKNIKVSKSKSKYRCRGEGLTGTTTRFSAMAIPSCHGKWVRLTLKQPKKCSYHESQFIFV